ncbi:E3 SUMO-protein ligase ZBED1-like [Gigantopelta aegis]|uniref:E3 SUMO-protein ligase ZBED1-like n=1 Tax=Gigantopelta aegis TaxID=1735272 RepID=UPI001B88D700|nr:E3 SUMO-protein ligase ZBED1-like [Gigantopelta aegis]
MVEQKHALNATLASITKVNNLSAHEWKTAEEYVQVLRPFEDATTIMSATRYSTLSMVIPVLNTLCDEMKAAELNTFGECIIKNINNRWPDYEKTQLFYIATVLDPRFKQYAFSSESSKIAARYTLLVEVLDIYEKKAEREKARKADVSKNIGSKHASSVVASAATTSTSTAATASTSTAAEQTEPSVEQSTTTSKSGKHDFWGLFKKKIAQKQDNEVQKQSKEELRAVMQYEIDRYLSEPLIDPSQCPFDWWKMHNRSYPNVSAVARLYLAIPSTSVPSERIFSKAGLIISDRRCSLKPSVAEQLVFLNHNLKAKGIKS